MEKSNFITLIFSPKNAIYCDVTKVGNGIPHKVLMFFKAFKNEECCYGKNYNVETGLV